jgi:alkanesulfonate monooxygenase SsuD/methylene tetrahydromethanopterin reductase-like flavin-dependent oxidoreductase (luciferase family)
MQIGFFAVGIGPSANPELLALTARAVEQCRFHSLWTGEHVVLVSQYASKCPYTQDGRMPLPTTKVDFLDPFATLSFAAAHSKTVRLGTSICLVPEHNPVVLAKQVASLDKLLRRPL